MSHELLYFHGNCHIDSPSWVSTDGTFIYIRCAQCDKLVVKLELKDKFLLACTMCEHEATAN